MPIQHVCMAIPFVRLSFDVATGTGNVYLTDSHMRSTVGPTYLGYWGFSEANGGPTADGCNPFVPVGSDFRNGPNVSVDSKVGCVSPSTT